MRFLVNKFVKVKVFFAKKNQANQTIKSNLSLNKMIC